MSQVECSHAAFYRIYIGWQGLEDHLSSRWRKGVKPPLSADHDNTPCGFCMHLLKHTPDCVNEIRPWRSWQSIYMLWLRQLVAFEMFWAIPPDLKQSFQKSGDLPCTPDRQLISVWEIMKIPAFRPLNCVLLLAMTLSSFAGIINTYHTGRHWSIV